MDDEKTPLQIAGRKLYDQLKHLFWCDGGFVVCIGEGDNTIHVYVKRKLQTHEAELIPVEVDGFPVKITVSGIMRLN